MRDVEATWCCAVGVEVLVIVGISGFVGLVVEAACVSVFTMLGSRHVVAIWCFQDLCLSCY